MIPRFSNPHLSLQSTKVVTRAELDAEDGEIFMKGDSKTTKQLRHLLDNSVLTWDVSEIRSNKLGENDQIAEEEPVLFRLISSTLPALPISFHPPPPPPPPPPITREPEVEDNELQADRRRKRAEAAAINVEDIQPRFGLTQASNSKILSAVASIPDPVPYLMIVQRQQPFRKTRPPVVPSELLHHPYVAGAAAKPSSLKTKYPIIEAQFGLPETPRRGRRRRRGKEALRARERPLPKYYRPDPRWEGKCRGYGYGY